MNSDNEALEDENSNRMTRRKLLSGAAASTAFLGSGCLGGLGEDEEEPTVAPPPGRSGNNTDTSPNNTTPTTEEKSTNTDTKENTTTEENISETEQETTTTDTGYEVEDPTHFNWETRDSLEETTGFCYIEDDYLGTIDADEVESALDEEHLYGEDPNNALNDGELIGAVEPLKPVNGNYAIDVDARHGDEIHFYVQLVGEQDGGVYLNRQGAYEVSELEWEEVFSEC